jgi:TPP-dependent pyruvate/acetoin dehydrogenase alpha subunit
MSGGQEAVAVGVCSALENDDKITSTHRLASAVVDPKISGHIFNMPAGESIQIRRERTRAE